MQKVSLDQGKLIAQSCGAMFQETSARTGEGMRSEKMRKNQHSKKSNKPGVETIFVKAAQAGYEKKKHKELKKAGIGLSNAGAPEEKGCSC